MALVKPQAGTAPFTQPLPKGTASGVLSKVGGAIGGLINNSIQNNPIRKAQSGQGNQLSSLTGGAIGVPAKAPEQNIKPPVTTIAPTQVKTTTPTPTGGNAQMGAKAPAQPVPPLANPKQNQDLVTGASNQNPTYAPSGGAIIPQGGTPPVAQNTPQNMQPGNTATSNGQPTPSPYSVNSGLYGQLIAAMANRSNQPGQQYTDAMGEYNRVNQQLADSRRNESNAEVTNRLNPIPIGDQTGREAVMRNQYLQQQGALGSQLQGASNVLGAANSQQGLLQQILQQAAAGSQPQTMTGGQYQMSPLGGGATDPAQGQATGFAAGSRAAVASQNDSQAVQHQSNADAISSKLQLIAPTVSKLTDFMSKYSLNGQPLPVVNKQINKMNAETESDAVSTMQAAIGDIVSNTQQILQAAGGMTDTQAGTIVNSWAQNMQSMTPAGLQAFAKNIETLGNIRLSQEQASAKAARDANQIHGGAPAQGMDADMSAQLQRAQETILNNLPDWAKAGAGALSGVAGGAANIAQGAAGSAVAGGIGGISGSLTKQVLGSVLK